MGATFLMVAFATCDREKEAESCGGPEPMKCQVSLTELDKDGPADARETSPPFLAERMHGGPPPIADAGDAGYSVNTPVVRSIFINDKDFPRD